MGPSRSATREVNRKPSINTGAIAQRHMRGKPETRHLYWGHRTEIHEVNPKPKINTGAIAQRHTKGKPETQHQYRVIAQWHMKGNPKPSNFKHTVYGTAGSQLYLITPGFSQPYAMCDCPLADHFQCVTSVDYTRGRRLQRSCWASRCRCAQTTSRRWWRSTTYITTTHSATRSSFDTLSSTRIEDRSLGVHRPRCKGREYRYVSKAI